MWVYDVEYTMYRARFTAICACHSWDMLYIDLDYHSITLRNGKGNKINQGELTVRMLFRFVNRRLTAVSIKRFTSVKRLYILTYVCL
jgi:hypothetical protein